MRTFEKHWILPSMAEKVVCVRRAAPEIDYYKGCSNYFFFSGLLEWHDHIKRWGWTIQNIPFSRREFNWLSVKFSLLHVLQDIGQSFLRKNQNVLRKFQVRLLYAFLKIICLLMPIFAGGEGFTRTAS